VLIQTGILIYGIVFAKRKEGDQGPPPATTNYMRAINKLASGKSFLHKAHFDVISEKFYSNQVILI
jgi:hypothetical protein